MKSESLTEFKANISIYHIFTNQNRVFDFKVFITEKLQ